MRALSRPPSGRLTNGGVPDRPDDRAQRSTGTAAGNPAAYTLEAMVGATPAGDHQGTVMRTPRDIPLSDYEDCDGRRVLIAELDELTLTYCVIERGPQGRALMLRRHVPSLREARRWATDYGDTRMRAKSRRCEAARSRRDR